MEYVSKFDIAEPQDVIQAKIRQFPVPLLPVQDGLLCLHEGCLHLCASVKRMKTHWLSSHGLSGQPGSDWCSVPLQTFFRGNLLRYFTDMSPGPNKIGRLWNISHVTEGVDTDSQVCHSHRSPLELVQ